MNQAKVVLADNSEIWVHYVIVDREKMVFVIDSMVHVVAHPDDSKVGMTTSLCWLMTAVSANAPPLKDLYSALRDAILEKEKA